VFRFEGSEFGRSIVRAFLPKKRPAKIRLSKLGVKRAVVIFWSGNDSKRDEMPGLLNCRLSDLFNCQIVV